MMINTMTNPSDIERIVMRRVRLIRLLTLIISTVMLAVITTVAALWGIGREVWIAHVFQNMPEVTHGSEFVTFWMTAFTHTRLLVQVLVVGTVASLLFLIREIARFVVSSFSRPVAP
jgi:hypothetical protein